MSYSGEAADQVVRMTLNGTEVAAKLSGAAAKEIAVMLYAILSDNKKSKGKTRLSNMLKSGKELKVFAVRDEDLAQFCRAAREYGVLYCVLKDRDANDGITDLMVKAEDASKINRIYERFELATVDRAAIRTELTRAKSKDKAEDNADRSTDERLIDAIMQNDDRKADEEKEADHSKNPTRARTEVPNLSERFSGSREKSETDIFADKSSRPSVRKQLDEIKAEHRKSHESRTRKVRERSPLPEKAHTGGRAR